MPGGLAKSDEIGFWDIEKRPGRRTHLIERGKPGHARQSRGSAAAGEPQKNGFGLIVGVMGGDDVVGADPHRAFI